MAISAALGAQTRARFLSFKLFSFKKAGESLVHKRIFNRACWQLFTNCVCFVK